MVRPGSSRRGVSVARDGHVDVNLTAAAGPVLLRAVPVHLVKHAHVKIMTAQRYYDERYPRTSSTTVATTVTVNDSPSSHFFATTSFIVSCLISAYFI